MYGAYQAMPPARRAELEQWESNNLDGGTIVTSDWPGWESLIGPRPKPLTRKATVYQRQLPLSLRMAVITRDGFACQRCAQREQLSVDHIVPRSRGGMDTLDNLQTLCRSCNSKKGQKV